MNEPRPPIAAALSRLYGVPSLRDEDRKKAIEVAALLDELARHDRDGLWVDAAAGHAYVGVLAAELLGARRVVVIERDPGRADRARAAAQQVSGVEVRHGDVADAALWPAAPDVVAALHACGPAADHILDAAVAANARWLLLVPCCYSHSLRFAARAEALAAEWGARQAEVRRRLVQSLVDTERTLRLEAAGYEVTVVPLVPPTVTPHNLMWRARRVGEPHRMAEAAARLAHLRGE